MNENAARLDDATEDVVARMPSIFERSTKSRCEGLRKRGTEDEPITDRGKDKLLTDAAAH